MIITDTHAHLYSDVFDQDKEAMMQRAFDVGVKRFFVPAIDSSHTAAMLDLEKTFPKNVHLMMGLHPTSVKENFKEELRHVEAMFKQRSFVAVGEIGIDLHWGIDTLSLQQQAFRFQIKLAKKYNLPIIIHCREAFDEIFEILEQEKCDKLFGIFHCFTGTLEQANHALSFNMKLGIGGVITFKNGNIDQFIHKIDLKNIVLETDAPYLSPVPYRGKRNESSYIVKVLNRLSELYEIPKEAIAEITTNNSKDIFNI